VIVSVCFGLCTIVVFHSFVIQNIIEVSVAIGFLFLATHVLLSYILNLFLFMLIFAFTNFLLFCADLRNLKLERSITLGELREYES